jgi:glycine oxidase
VLRSVNVVIVGQGLAGTAVAWWLRWSGRSFMIIDAEPAVTASRVAAGLLTPITGQRLVVSWEWSRLWDVAVRFYRQVEATLHTPVFHILPMVRRLVTDEELTRYEHQRLTPDFAALADPMVTPALSEADFHPVPGGFTMPRGGRLDVVRYLDMSREFFRQQDCYQTGQLDLARELIVEPDCVSLPRFQLEAQQVVFCQGVSLPQNPWFHAVDLKPAVGELLTVHIPGLNESRVIHQTGWLLPLGNDQFRVGATYRWDHLVDQPSAAGRAELEQSLQQMLRRPYTVVDHQGAVRPIHRNQYPILGRHPQYPALACLNGLGSKGALQGPEAARQLVELLNGRNVVDREFDLARRKPRR